MSRSDERIGEFIFNFKFMSLDACFTSSYAKNREEIEEKNNRIIGRAISTRGLIESLINRELTNDECDEIVDFVSWKIEKLVIEKKIFKIEWIEPLWT